MKRDPRRDFVAATVTCQLCGIRQATDCHEMNRGSALRQKALNIPAALLAVCRYPCHADLGDAVKWPLVAQLAVKKIRQPDVYDRLAVLRARVCGGEPTRMDNAVTEQEVDAWVVKLKQRKEFA